MTLQRLLPAERTMRLVCRPDWAEMFPQSAHLLREEMLAWEKTAWTLDVVGV
jgi:exopolyphosphatase/guanosine-5'-triphosphate,3'-diphosphate pyrophosphatase